MKDSNIDFLIVGDGRLSKHLQHWFTLKNINLCKWNRRSQNPTELESLASNSKWLLLAISDSSLESFIQTNFHLGRNKFIHFSGSLVIPGIKCFHPMMTFSNELYSLADYEKIHFAAFDKSDDFRSAFSKLNNPTFYISTEQKPLYHALCSFTGLLS